MPFLGVEPVQEFASVAKQTITGDGSTAYTLTHSVGSANDLAVFVNNVRQEPTTAYSASATTITFTEAIASTDSCYVMYIARTFSSASPEANSVGITELNVSDGSNGQALTTNGSGTLSFATVTTATPTLAAVTGAGATTTNAVTIGNLTSTGIDDNATSTAVTIDANENIGIGTTSTTALRLSVVTPTANHVATQIENSNTADSFGLIVKAGNDANDYTADFRKRDNTGIMRIRGDGKVGIGTTSPADLVTLSGSGPQPAIRLITDAGTYNGVYHRIFPAGDGTALAISADKGNSGAGSYIRFDVDDTERMRINSSGYVTKPNTPVFSYGAYTTYTVSGTGTQIVSTSTAFNNSSYVHLNYNNGSHFNPSNGRFTAPIAGIYRLEYRCGVADHDSGYFWWYIYKNGSSAIAYWQSAQGVSSGSNDIAFISMHVNVNMAANDYLDVRWANNYVSGVIYYPHISGFLIA